MDDVIAAASPLSGHHRGKLKRRRAILDAARGIMSASGVEGLTMTAVAGQAGVSPATPYNLFGSKQTILRIVYEEDLAIFLRRFDEVASPVPLVRLFDVIEVSVEHWRGAPDFYKVLLQTLYRCAGLDSELWSPRMTIFRAMVKDVGDAGGLLPDAPVYLLSDTLVRVFKSIAQEWVDGSVELEPMRKALGLSFAMILSGLVSPAAREALAEVRQRYV